MVLLEDMQKMPEPEESYKSEKSTLLRKFDIPLHHLEFSYIETCNDGRELEKILQILRSGEEGYYPDLTKTTELRLAEVKPNSRYIRKLTPVLSKESVDHREMQEISDDLSKWLGDIAKSNDELQRHNSHATKSLPEVRKSSEIKPITETKVNKRIQSTDYASWDKYDADTAILTMDLQDEKLRNEAKKSDPPKKKAIKFCKFSTRAEAIYEANRRKEKGNECFKAGEYEDALEHYTVSIECFPTITLYTNRAVTYIKLKKYQEAISDCEEAFKFDPNNLKVHLRLAQSYEALNKHQQALHHAEKVIKIDPNNNVAQKIAEKARQFTGDVPRNVRFKIVELDDTIEAKTPKKSILKKSKSNVEIIPIPGTSKMNSPYYKTVYSRDPDVITKEKVMINKRPQPLFLTTIDTTSDEDGDCLENHLVSSKRNVPLKEDATTTDKTEVIEKRPRSKVEIEESRHVKSRKQNQAVRDEKRTVISNEMTTKRIEEISSDVNTQIKANSEELAGNAPTNSKPMINVKVEEINLDSGAVVNDEFGGISHNLAAQRRNDRRGVGNNLNAEDDIRGGGEPHVLEMDTERVPIQIHLPYTFLQTWQSVRRRDHTYAGFASILRNVDMERITEVIGNKIDATILSDIINSLYRHFTVASEVEKVYSALVNLCRLERFGIVAMFLSNDDKRLVRNLMDFLIQHGYDLPPDVKMQYGF